MFHKIISASLSPNTEPEDVYAALKVLCQPWMWKRGSSITDVINWFEKRYIDTRAFAYNSGRSAFTDILEAFGIGAGDDVLVQSFTCVAVPNSVLWAHATPIFVDIDSTLNIDLQDAKRKITKRTKAIVVQHTLGITADIASVRAFAKRHNLKLIEDCAHALGAYNAHKQVGTDSDAAFFSFGRDKILSSVFGGVAIVNRTHIKSIEYMSKKANTLKDASAFWILQQILHPIIFSIVLPTYTIGIGKILLRFFQMIRLLSFPVYPIEKLGGKPDNFPSRYPNGLANLLCVQLRKLDRYNAHRKEIAAYYEHELRTQPTITLLTYTDGSIFLRFPILVKNPDVLMSNAKRQGILLGNWYRNTIDPVGVDFASIGYEVGSCPHAENISKQIINLPTRITMEEAKRVVYFLTRS